MRVMGGTPVVPLVFDSGAVDATYVSGSGTDALTFRASLLRIVAITLMVLSVNLFGDWLRDRLDPRLRQL